tara:strand:- start:343 stop:525 length:183 start_codon:yes stop_codon:yes gene_type:complete
MIDKDKYEQLRNAIWYDVHNKEQVEADLKVLDEVFAEVRRLRKKCEKLTWIVRTQKEMNE